ncbi:hypothetical protein [Amycolatopsis sp. H20-H5]|uniref:hypothetical protein n=1 Tax=Amycolatopsis sp. H20-H5 TaxID=3046309 RepID=UPI002DBCED30|nr:hypothetical protein [Amycolatopsis sp. H20-H5]MEC3982243.1 hypothetical protein [Amycolatopsis sp. H20-H5]
MTDGEDRLPDRIKDLHASLATGIGWLLQNMSEDGVRPDVLRDLGADLVRRSDALDAEILAHLPGDGWLPEAGARWRALPVAHNVGPRPLRCGAVFLSLCGAACFPFYGKDPLGETVRHHTCPDCRSLLA